MSTFTYSKQDIERHLEPMSSRGRVAFGLACCERMFPNYVAFKQEAKWGNEQPLRRALDELWKQVEGNTMDGPTAKRLWEDCDKVAPDADDFTITLVGPAQDACCAICCVLDYVLKENPERIAQASSFAIDTLDGYIQELEAGFSKTPATVLNTPEREERIRLHPLMQRELARQDADLKLLANKPDLGSLKAQWRAPAKSNFDL